MSGFKVINKKTGYSVTAKEVVNDIDPWNNIITSFFIIDCKFGLCAEWVRDDEKSYFQKLDETLFKVVWDK